MKKLNFKSKKLFTTAFFITSGLAILGPSNPVRADGPCPEASTFASPLAFGASQGSCYGTPETYGVTVYRMALCTSDPAPTSAGTSPDVSSCSFTFQKTDGEPKSFALSVRPQRTSKASRPCTKRAWTLSESICPILITRAPRKSLTG